MNCNTQEIHKKTQNAATLAIFIKSATCAHKINTSDFILFI